MAAQHTALALKVYVLAALLVAASLRVGDRYVPAIHEWLLSLAALPY